jgi:precorrin-3B synthase
VNITAISATKVHLWPGNITVDISHAATAAVTLAEAFLDERYAQASTADHAAWRITELRDGPKLIAKRALDRLHAYRIEAAPCQLRSSPRPPRPLGVAAQSNGLHSLAAHIPLGRLVAGQARAIAELCGPRGVRITPWRSIVATDVTNPARAVETLARIGLGVDAASPWPGVTACAGRPGCAKALADVQADARTAATAMAIPFLLLPVHWSGCARRCGRPSDTSVDVLATTTGYVISDASGRIRRVADPASLAKTVEVLRRG